jgi:hypothetical protein
VTRLQSLHPDLGTFSLREGDSYSAPKRGYLYYAAPRRAKEECRKEWAVLKKMANRARFISFGICGEPNVRAQLRKPSVPSSIHPLTSIEFPNKDPNGKPIKITAVLNERC